MIAETNFNPRTREGCDKSTDEKLKWLFDISIHAPVKGATTASDNRSGFFGYFNPRTREGCDHVQLSSRLGTDDNFNPRTREGCDPNMM